MTGAEREKYIWSRLTAAGLTPAGAAGLMGNLYAESGLNPANLQNTHKRHGSTPPPPIHSALIASTS